MWITINEYYKKEKMYSCITVIGRSCLIVVKIMLQFHEHVNLFFVAKYILQNVSVDFGGTLFSWELKHKANNMKPL